MPKRVGFLYEKMCDKKFIRSTILDAARRRHKRHDIAKVLADLDGYVDRAYDMLVNDSYVPSQPKEVERYDESSQKWRHIQMVPFWPDGIMQWLLVAAMKPVLMRGMHPWSCASVPGRGGIRVHKKIQRVMRHDPKGSRYAAELDVAHYYPSVSIKRLIWMLARKIKDKRFLKMVYSILETCGGGLGIGYYMCQWLANYYLERIDWQIETMPGITVVTRHMDNYTLLGPNKKQLHKAVQQIAELMKKIGLTMKKNWQVYRTTFTTKVAQAHALLPERKRRLRKPRMVAAVGYRYSHKHTILRKRNFLRLTRQCRKAKKRLDAGRRVTYKLASGLMSRAGQLRHCDSHKVRVKYIDPIKVKNLKEVIRYESKRRLGAQQCVFAGGAA